MNQLAPGTVLSGRYQLTELIGVSDLSTVYAAVDQRNQAPVAVKLFATNVTGRAAALSEYQMQARQVSGLGVEGIARAYDFGIDANSGLSFSTAERVGWVSLDRRVAAHGPLGLVELSRALAVLARALDAAHAAGVVHRDLKPQNVFISADNPEWTRITDFGVSAVRRGAPEALGWGGPPGYTPPEAVDAGATAAPSVDTFALGIVAFFALTRGTPFRSLRNPGFDPNAHWSELNQPLSPLTQRAKEIGVALDHALDPWFARALALAPHERFRSAGEMARELSALAELVSARGGGGPRPMPGIAAAIAQPLVFQPEPSPASLGLGPRAPGSAGTSLPPSARSLPPAAAPTPTASPALASEPADEAVAGLPPRRSLLPVFAGLGVILLGGIAFASFKAFSKGGTDDASAAGVASAPASAAPTASAAPVAPPSGPARVRFSCQPEACEWVVCGGQNVSGIEGEVELTPGAHDCSASRSGFGSKSVAFTAIPGQATVVTFELPPVPESTQQKAALANPATASKAAVTSAPPAKPASAPTPAPKPVAAAPTPTAAAKPPAAPAPTGKPTTKKKKCSTFLGCK